MQAWVLELKAIAAVVVGGTAITGGRGTMLVRQLIGVALLGTIGTALTFVGINPFWEKAIQGAIILAALLPICMDKVNRLCAQNRLTSCECDSATCSRLNETSIVSSKTAANVNLQVTPSWRERFFPNNEWVLLLVVGARMC